MRCTEIRPSRQRENGITGCTNSIRHDFKPLQTLLLFARAVGQSSIRLTTFGNGKDLAEPLLLPTSTLSALYGPPFIVAFVCSNALL